MNELSMVQRPASLVDWSMAPAWVAVDNAAFLVGMAAEVVQDWIDQGLVEADDRSGVTLVERASLREFWEIVHGDDGGLFDDA
jgi:hypothetical protein